MSTKKTNKYQEIYQAAKTVFWKYGFKKVNVEDICTEAKVSRRTFYKYFKNKNDLALKILNDLFNEKINEYRDLLKSSIDYKKKIEKLFQIKLQAVEEISIEFIKDMFSLPQFQSLFNNMKKISYEFTIDLIEQGKKENCVRKDIPTEFVIYQLDRLYEQMNDPQLYKIFNDPQELTKNILDFFFYGIMEH